MEKDHINGRRLLPSLVFCYIGGSLIGLVLEGIWTTLYYGKWESHVVSMWLPLCILYGMGIASFFAVGTLLHEKPVWMQFLMVALVCDLLELISGELLYSVLGMRAWDYTDSICHYKGIVSLEMTVVWGVLGTLFIKFAFPPLNRLFDRIRIERFFVLSVILAIWMAGDLVFTSICMVRWSERHRGIAASGSLDEWIDKTYDDDFMSKRFMEWKFIA